MLSQEDFVLNLELVTESENILLRSQLLSYLRFFDTMVCIAWFTHYTHQSLVLGSILNLFRLRRLPLMTHLPNENFIFRVYTQLVLQLV